MEQLDADAGKKAAEQLAKEKQESGSLRTKAYLVLAWLLALSIASIVVGLFLLTTEPR
jgi:hypothetical protein